ncbi:PAS domain-containing sensor histidine kinase, partial [Massilia terrae]
MTDDHATPSSTCAFPGAGEMVRAVNEKDWSQTILGPLERWPEAIRSAVRLSLASQFQMAVLVGPDLVYVYNDQCAQIFGDKHPWALGRPVREVWPEAWDSLEPLLTDVLETGRPCRRDDLLLVLHRAGFTEECYFTVSYSAIYDAGHAIAGVLVNTIETTQRVLAERRQRWLGELAIQVAQRRGADGALDLLRDAMATNPFDLPLVALYLAEGESARRVFCSGLRSGGARIPTSLPWPAPGAAAPAHPFAALALTGASQLFEAAAMLDEGDRCGAWDEPVRQLLAVPLALAGPGQARGLMVVALNPLVRCDDNYLRFVHTTVGLVATAIAGADALEAERRRAETLAELDLSRSRFSALNREVAAIRDDLTKVIEGASDAIVSYDHELKIRSLNAAAARSFDREVHQLAGRQLLDVAPEVAGTALLEALRAVAAGGRPEAVEHYHPAGRRWYEVRILPAPYGVLAFGADISARKAAEQAMRDANAILERRVHERTGELREAHQLLAAVFDRAPGAVAITSIEGDYLRVNQAYLAMLGCDEKWLARRSLSQLVEPADFDAAAPWVARLLAGEVASCRTEMRFRRAGGEMVWVLSFLSLIEDGDGRPRYLVHMAKDVTKRRQREAERRAAQEELKSLYRRLETVREMERAALAREVHDQLGQVLSAAKIDIRLLEDHILALDGDHEPEEVARELRGASGTLDRALQIVRDIATELRAPELDGQGLYAALEWHARDFEQRTRIRTSVEVEAGLPQPARPAAEALLRIFQEALTNVLRHAHAGEVRVTLERRGQNLLLRVRDDGRGIGRG